MFIIAGLGNPSKEYDNTRHNVVVTDWDALANAVSHDVDVPDCSKERPSGEKLDSGITITIAAAA